MADFSHSLQRTQPSATLSKKISSNGNGFTAKTVYDDVFGGPPKFGVPTFSSRIDDYNEIFGSFHSSRVSSIPILDLPIVDESDFAIDVRNSKFDYSEVFGGFNGLDFAVSYEELLAEPKGVEGGESSSDDVWTSAETGSPSEGSSEDPACSENNQAFSNEESYQSLDGSKQFNMLYHKTNQISREDGISATTHIAELNSVPAFTFVVDESIPLQKAEMEKTMPQVTKLCSHDVDFGGQVMGGKHLEEAMSDQPVCNTVTEISESDPKHQSNHLQETMSHQPVCNTVTEISESDPKHQSNHLKETMSHQPVCHTVTEISESDLKHQSNHLKETMSHQPVCYTVTQISDTDLKHKKNPGVNETFPTKAFLTVSEINLRTLPSHVPPPSRPPPKLSIKQGDSKRLMASNFKASENYVLERGVGDGSPPFFDVEVDASSSAAASAAAMKEAMEKAQARLKSAKESMERKRDGLQNRKKLGLKNDFKVEERREGETTHDAHWLKEKAHGTLERVNNEMKGFAMDDRQKTTRVVQVSPDFQVAAKLVNASKELVEQKHGEEYRSTQESHKREEGTGEWKVEEQYYELVQTDKLTTAMEVPKHEKMEDSISTQRVQEYKMKAAKMAFDHQEKNDRKSKAVKEVCKGEKDRAELGVAEEACKWEEHEKKIKAVQEREKYMKELNAAQEVCNWEENEKNVRVELEGKEHDEEEKVSHEREENEKKLKESREREEHEKQLRQAREKEEYEMKMKKIREQEEHEKKQKEAREREVNEKREKMAREREENEKRLKEAREQEENEKRLKEAREQEESVKRLKEAREQEESEKRLKEAHEREENEKRQKEAHEREENAKRLKEAHELEEREKQREARDRERKENEKRLKEDRERKENEKRLNEAREREENEKRLNEAREREENERRLKEARDREENERRLKEVRDKEENEKRLKEVCEREEKERRMKEARSQEENEMRQQEHKREDNEKKLKAAQEDLVHLEDERNLKTWTESLESEQKLKLANEVCKQDEDKKLNATREACKQEQDTYVDQSAPEHEEIGKTMESAKRASENGRELKAAEKVLNDQDGNYRLEVKHVDRSDPEHEELENKKRVASEAKLQDNEKYLGEPQAAVLQEKNVRNKKSYQGAIDQEENKIKYNGVHGKKELVENGKKMEAAYPTNVAEERGEKLKMGPGVNISQDTERKEKILSESILTEEKEKEERMQREREREKERLRKVEEDREREREREKDRMAVERATREARERAFADARERAERAAVERATAEARQRAMAEARERLEKASAEAREKSLAEKASTEARIRVERAAVERATAEARERAAEKAKAEKVAFGARERAERTFSEKFSATPRDSGMKHSYSSSDLRDSQVQSSSSSSSFQRYPSSSNLGASYVSEKFQGAEIESAQRCKARLERHQRTVERAAKALAEKNMRDLLAQREQAERNRFAETLDAEVKRWSSGKEGNLRALLSTLQYILGPESGWQPIPLTEVITAIAVKKAYRKATLCVHPDKLQQRGASIQQKYICEKVFDLLKVHPLALSFSFLIIYLNSRCASHESVN
ncbi:hypothetical protein BVC80_1117g72 [Macleaya cordata]|uniref:DnaJ domain n=1 Tax=Macleaya cordata TaxID=56857 RepID=A0A200Q9F1_MACCD|nr:hypothetical protein BVC80_1117g72 [Macleaya cordata]